MIQAAITRMAQNSFLIKGWTVTLIAALLAMGAKDANPLFAWIGLGPAIVFWCIDAYYLWLEQGFRDLHSVVAADLDKGIKTVAAFDMKPRTEWHGYWKNVFCNPTVMPLYMLVVVLVIIVGVFFGKGPGLTRSVSPAAQSTAPINLGTPAAPQTAAPQSP